MQREGGALGEEALRVVSGDGRKYNKRLKKRK